MRPRTRAGLLKFRPLRSGSRVALVAPASPFAREEFDAGLAELKRLGLKPVYDESIFDRRVFLAGTAAARAEALHHAWSQPDIDAIIAVRGGYGSVETLPMLSIEKIRSNRTAFIGYSDLTSLHTFLGGKAGLASVHGVMIDGRLARGPSTYDPDSFLRALGAEPLGELAPPDLHVVRAGEASGPLFGGTLTQLLSSFGTPYEFHPPSGHVLFIDEVSERPYRLHRMLTQWRLAGRFEDCAAVVFGQMPKCDEPGGTITALQIVHDCLLDFPRPVLFGFPSGHTTTPLISLPFGVETRVIASGDPKLVVEESAAEQ